MHEHILYQMFIFKYHEYSVSLFPGCSKFCSEGNLPVEGIKTQKHCKVNDDISSFNYKE